MDDRQFWLVVVALTFSIFRLALILAFFLVLAVVIGKVDPLQVESWFPTY